MTLMNSAFLMEKGGGGIQGHGSHKDSPLKGVYPLMVDMHAGVAQMTEGQKMLNSRHVSYYCSVLNHSILVLRREIRMFRKRTFSHQSSPELSPRRIEKSEATTFYSSIGFLPLWKRRSFRSQYPDRLYSQEPLFPFYQLLWVPQNSATIPIMTRAQQTISLALLASSVSLLPPSSQPRSMTLTYPLTLSSTSPVSST